MVGYILVPATGTTIDAAVFRTASAIAKRRGSHLAFLHIRDDMQDTTFTTAGDDLAGGHYRGAIDAVQHDVEARQRRAHDAVTAFCRGDGVALGDTPAAGWSVEAGDLLHCLIAHARAADLTVLGRADHHQIPALHLLETVLLGSGRPLVVAPADWLDTVGRRIAIAWNNSRQAARAVAAALPLLASAECVTVITVAEPAAAVAAVDAGSALRLRDALRWHNQATTLRALPPGNQHPAEQLLAAAAGDGIDLLVMGGYSRSRIREAMFGGVTRHVLQAAALPVLMVH